MNEYNSPKCCKQKSFMELKSVTEIKTKDEYFMTHHFQCQWCGKIKEIMI